MSVAPKMQREPEGPCELLIERSAAELTNDAVPNGTG
jgi:hypothetical protein